MDELLKAIKKKLADMKKIESTGFSDPAKAAEYFQDKEILLEEMAKALETVASDSTAQVEQLEKTVKGLRDELILRMKKNVMCDGKENKIEVY